MDFDPAQPAADDDATLYVGNQAAAGGNRATTQSAPPASHLAATVAEPTGAAIQVPEPTGALEPGAIINEKFQLEEAIGEGGMGVIYRAKDLDLVQFKDRNPYVALKMLSETFSNHPDSLMALNREARNAKSLTHENIVRVNEFARDRQSGQYFMNMEYLRGEPLNRYAQREAMQGMGMDKVWPIIEGTGLGLAYAHKKNIIHSDVKPSNIWLTDDNKVKVLDFGIARAVEADTQTVWQGIGAVTPRYASPEMLKREEPDPRDDVYGLACVAYELLCGEHPFQKLDAVQAQTQKLKLDRPKRIPRMQWRALRHALAFDRQARTPTIEAFLAEFAPQQPQRIRGLKRAVSALVVTAGALTFGIGMYNSPTPTLGPSQQERYMQELLQITPAAEQDKEQLQFLLDGGHMFAEDGQNDFGINEHQRGNASLKNGASNAYRAFYDVLLGTSDADMRRAAALGMYHIERTYTEAVAILKEDGLPKKALWLTCQGLASPPNTHGPKWHELETLYTELWLDVKGDTPKPYAQSCTPANVPDSWGTTMAMRRALRR